MIDEAKLDSALLWVATDMDPSDPKALIKRWQRFFPSSIYPFLVAEYRRRIGAPSFAVLQDGSWFTQEARSVLEDFRHLTSQMDPSIASLPTDAADGAVIKECHEDPIVQQHRMPMDPASSLMR